MSSPLLANRYLLGRELGRGGMGLVYEATDTRTGGRVAVKIVHPAFAVDKTAITRLRQEAHLAARLASPTVVRVIDLDQEGELTFLVMEYVAGPTLAEVADRHYRLPLSAVLMVTLEVAQALDAAHAAGIVHRDLKPQNIIISGNQVKVLDFGIARVLNETRITHTDSFLGTLEYASPEQIAGGGDTRSDIYSLGVMVFRLLAGQPPFTGPTPAAVMWQHEHLPPPRLTGDTPPAVQALVDRCLAKDPNGRFQTPAELITALHDLMDTLGLSARAALAALSALSASGNGASPRDAPPPASAPTITAPHPPSEGTDAPTAPVGRGVVARGARFLSQRFVSRAALASLAALSTVVAVTLAVVAWRGSGEPPAPTPPSTPLVSAIVTPASTSAPATPAPTAAPTAVPTRTPTSTPIPTAPVGTLLFEDNFENEQAGRLNRLNDAPSLRTVAYREGAYVITKVDPVWNALVTSYTPLSFGDTITSVDARLNGPSEARLIAVFCRTTGTNGYQVVIRPYQRLVDLRRIDNGVGTSMGVVNVPTIRPGNEWNNIELRCAGNQIGVKVNGADAISRVDGSYRTGSAGIGVGVDPAYLPNRAEAHFDNLKIIQQ